MNDPLNLIGQKLYTGRSGSIEPATPRQKLLRKLASNAHHLTVIDAQELGRSYGLSRLETDSLIDEAIGRGWLR